MNACHVLVIVKNNTVITTHAMTHFSILSTIHHDRIFKLNTNLEISALKWIFRMNCLQLTHLISIQRHRK